MELDQVYGSDLTRIIDRYQPDEWIFGHTHHRAEIREGRTLVRNVSLGYPGEVPAGDEAGVLLPSYSTWGLHRLSQTRMYHRRPRMGSCGKGL